MLDWISMKSIEVQRVSSAQVVVSSVEVIFSLPEIMSSA